MTRDYGEAPHIKFVTQNLFGRAELWAVGIARPRTGFGEPIYRGLFTVASGEDPRHIHSCALGQTPLNAKETISRKRTAELHPELVR